MSTIKNLEKYSAQLKKWADKKRKAGLMGAGVTEPEPLPSQFEIGANEIEWAEKIRRKIMAHKLPPAGPVNLDDQIPKTIKMPVRKIKMPTRKTI